MHLCACPKVDPIDSNTYPIKCKSATVEPKRIECGINIKLLIL